MLTEIQPLFLSLSLLFTHSFYLRMRIMFRRCVHAFAVHPCLQLFFCSKTIFYVFPFAVLWSVDASKPGWNFFRCLYRRCECFYSHFLDVTWCAVANYNPQFLLFDEVSKLKATERIQQRRWQFLEVLTMTKDMMTSMFTAVRPR